MAALLFIRNWLEVFYLGPILHRSKLRRRINLPGKVDRAALNSRLGTEQPPGGSIL